MSEEEVRSKVKASAARLARRLNARPTYLVEELEVEGGRARIDIAFVGEHFIGLEIKSCKDNLSRLAQQSRYYAPYFDFLVLVADSKMVDSAFEILPSYWGVIAIETKESSISLTQLRKAEPNPERNISELLRLLWKDELLALAADEGYDPKMRRMSKSKLRSHISKYIPSDLLRKNCIDILVDRTNWRTKELNSDF